MPFETKNMRGALFTNDNKEHDKQPDFTGNVKIGDKLWRLAGWKSTSRSGGEYISLSVSDPADFQRPGNVEAPTHRVTDNELERYRERIKANLNRDLNIDDDDIPF